MDLPSQELIYPAENLLDLPIETLIIIYEYLLVSDRRVTSQVCKRFLDIWLREKFIDDRLLVFRDCILDATSEPYNIFIKSERIYTQLEFVDVEFRQSKKLDQLWKKLGKSVTKLEIFNCPFPAENFWKLFFKLEELHLQDIVSGTCHFEYLPKSLKKITLSYFANPTEILTAFDEKYLKFRSNDVIIELRGEDFTSNTNFIRKYSKNFGMLCLDAAQWIPLQDLHFTNLKSLHLNLRYSAVDFDQHMILDNLEEKCPNLNDCFFNLEEELPHKDWRYLKSLSIACLEREDIPLLFRFANLEDLFISDDKTTGCFFVHEPIVNMNIKNIQILMDRSNLCTSCFEAMAKSLPNLKSIHTVPNITNEHLNILASSSRKLETLSIGGKSNSPLSFEYFHNLTEIAWHRNTSPNIDTWPLMPHLRSLDITIDHLSVSKMDFFEKLPAMEHLEINFEYIDGDAHDLLLGMVKPMKRLRDLTVNSKASMCMDVNTIQEMTENCQYLRYISFHVVYDKILDLNALSKVFEKNSAVNFIAINHQVYTWKDSKGNTRNGAWSISNGPSILGAIVLSLSLTTAVVMKGLPIKMD